LDVLVNVLIKRWPYRHYFRLSVNLIITLKVISILKKISRIDFIINFIGNNLFLIKVTFGL